MVSILLLFALPLSGAVTDIERALQESLAGGPANVAAAQAAWAETLGLRQSTPDGVIATGNRVSVRALDPASLAGEILEGARIRHYVEVSGYGPEPLHLYLPRSSDGQPDTVYRRVEPGLFLEPGTAPEAVGDFWKVEVTWPGRFLVHEPAYPGEGKALFPVFPPTSTDPGRRRNWHLFRAIPHAAVGPVPLLLIHGAANDRWVDFLHWAEHSAEAAAFRQQFQIWNFSHNMTGVNAAIGYDPDCPSFEQSIIAYLHRFLEEATEFGAPTVETFYKFPAEGPITIITNSHGALKARAFMVNFPDYGDRVAAAVTLGGPHMGTPWGTVEWLRHTVSRLGLLTPTIGERIVADALDTNYVSLEAQSDLDMGWLNADRGDGYGGIPYRTFHTWTGTGGVERRVLSPRDSTVTGARELPGFDDNTFDPQELLTTYCGGLDRITPAARGDMYMDRFFVHGAYLHRGRGWLDLLVRADDGLMEAGQVRFENSALRIVNVVMGMAAAEDADWPVGAYRLADGFVPLQSQLMLDGRETRPVYKTFEVMGWHVPVLPFTPAMDVIEQHTLVDPERIRIWPGWSHLDLTTGRYSRETGESALYRSVAEDLLSVLPAG